MTTDEFRSRFASESDTVEFKQGLSAIQESAVAFSNTLGGVIVAGVRNDGSIQGLRWTPMAQIHHMPYLRPHSPCRKFAITLGRAALKRPSREELGR
jgi:hypothetical protein